MGRNHVVAFISAAVLSAVVTTVSTSHALKMSAHSCMKSNSTLSEPSYIESGVGANKAGFVYCPYPDVPGAEQVRVRSIYVDGQDYNTTANLWVKVMSFPYLGGYLTFSRQIDAIPRTTPTTGEFNLLISAAADLDPWKNSAFGADYGYLFVSMPIGTKVYGYTTYF